MVADPENNSYRESTAQDLYDMARIADTCEHIHMFQRTCVLRDIPDNYEMDLNTAYCVVMGTGKHVASSWTEAAHLEKTLEMLHVMAGGEAAWRARPFVSQSNCFVVPPHEVCAGIAGMPAGRGPGRHAGAAAVRGAGRRHHACMPGRRRLPGLGRMSRRPGCT